MIPADVDERSQYLSAEWIEQARSFLGDNPIEGDFSICESYESPPPGINGSFWIRVTNGSVEVGEGVIDDAAIHIEGIYHAALEMAQIPFVAGQDAVGRAFREAQHRWGESALRVVKGDTTNLPRAINKLHDYMAARTIENPNLANRLQQMGLERHAADLVEKGYTVIENVISEEFADELRELTIKEVHAYSELATNGLATRHRLYEEALLNPFVNAVMQAELGKSMINSSFAGSHKTTGPGVVPMHTDAQYVHEPLPEWSVTAVSCWALDEWTESAGPTWVIPGSHKWRRRPRPGDPQDGAVPILMPKGSVAIWVDSLWHWQGDRADEGARVALHITNNRVFARQLDEINLTDEILSRNPPAYTTLMGMDDPFGRTNAHGHDLKRMMHVAQVEGMMDQDTADDHPLNEADYGRG